MAATRRVGTATSKTRNQLLDCAQQLLVDDGYAGVTYRKLAARAGVTPGLVQYYFPSLDDVFVATIRRETERNIRRLTAALEERPAESLRVLWDYARDEAATAVMMEFMALGNHRPSIQTEIAEATNRVRAVQLEAVTRHLARVRIPVEGLTPAAVLFLLAGIPKMVQLEEGFGISVTHTEVLALVERWLDRLTP